MQAARKKRIVTWAWLIVAIGGAPVSAQRLEPRIIPSRDIEAFSFASPSMGERYDIVVGSPPGYRASGKRYPALVVTDGSLAFPIAFDAARSLGTQDDIEPMFVISIGAPLELGDTAFVRRRVFEFSPPGWAMTDPFGQSVSKTCREMTHAPPGRCTGGAPKFLDFIITELLPAVAAKYPIDTTRLGLFGVSAGGFFAAWTAFQERSPFTSYVISSAALAYGDDQIFRDEERWASTHKDLKAGIYLSSGSREAENWYLEGVGHIASGQAKLAATLSRRNYPGLRLTSEVLQGFQHGDGTGTALVRGLRALYGKDGRDVHSPYK